MKLCSAEADAILQAVSNGTLSILKARRNLGDDNIAIPEVRISVGHILKCMSLFEPQPAILADSLHRYEGYRRIFGYSMKLGLHRVNLYLEAQTGHRPHGRHSP